MASDEEMPKAQSSMSVAQDKSDADAGSSAAGSAAGALQVAEEKAPAALSDEYIRLRVITSDMTDEVHFRVKSATTLGRLKRSYCSKMGFQVEDLRFVFDGQRITDDDTPKSLGMVNDDVIEIYQQRTGGSNVWMFTCAYT